MRKSVRLTPGIIKLHPVSVQQEVLLQMIEVLVGSTRPLIFGLLQKQMTFCLNSYQLEQVR